MTSAKDLLGGNMDGSDFFAGLQGKYNAILKWSGDAHSPTRRREVRAFP
jgi:hypothetical protein